MSSILEPYGIALDYGFKQLAGNPEMGAKRDYVREGYRDESVRADPANCEMPPAPERLHR